MCIDGMDDGRSNSRGFESLLETGVWDPFRLVWKTFVIEGKSSWNMAFSHYLLSMYGSFVLFHAFPDQLRQGALLGRSYSIMS